MVGNMSWQEGQSLLRRDLHTSEMGWVHVRPCSDRLEWFRGSVLGVGHKWEFIFSIHTKFAQRPPITGFPPLCVLFRLVIRSCRCSPCSGFGLVAVRVGLALFIRRGDRTSRALNQCGVLVFNAGGICPWTLILKRRGIFRMRQAHFFGWLSLNTAARGMERFLMDIVSRLNLGARFYLGSKVVVVLGRVYRQLFWRMHTPIGFCLARRRILTH
ncbi:hypothetical protein BCR34DRAFT_553048 [Clohesyomyces aquaticus]|uniref:Uncharacterized protein n=1 Tax=Clohesyomyces aquaticus TaxID=1231657 RepID=A0A1Y2A948_9PLEO|nr:hypothetical protein BCR34DRAFT_553048 [Clohesyomyces aquaticus]